MRNGAAMVFWVCWITLAFEFMWLFSPLKSILKFQCWHAYRDCDLVRRIGAATALEVKASGIHYTFAPCVAVRNCNQL